MPFSKTLPFIVPPPDKAISGHAIFSPSLSSKKSLLYSAYPSFTAVIVKFPDGITKL